MRSRPTKGFGPLDARATGTHLRAAASVAHDDEVIVVGEGRAHVG
jgi:hypothetical protein